MPPCGHLKKMAFIWRLSIIVRESGGFDETLPLDFFSPQQEKRQDGVTLKLQGRIFHRTHVCFKHPLSELKNRHSRLKQTFYVSYQAIPKTTLAHESIYICEIGINLALNDTIKDIIYGTDCIHLLMYLEIIVPGAACYIL